MFRAICSSLRFLSILIFGSLPASADSGVTYTISGDYSPTTSTSQLSGPSETFMSTPTAFIGPIRRI